MKPEKAVVMKKLMMLVFLLFVCAGCAGVETVSGSRLIELTKSWKEPKVAIWYYTGSDSKYHYFEFLDLGGKKIYRVNKEDLLIEPVFPFSRNRKKWRVMPWGPQSLVKENSPVIPR